MLLDEFGLEITNQLITEKKPEKNPSISSHNLICRVQNKMLIQSNELEKNIEIRFRLFN